MNYGKIGVGSGAARVQILISYQDENGAKITIADQIFSDNRGPRFDNRSPATLGETAELAVPIPDGVTSVTVELIDRTLNGDSSDIAVDNISLDVVCFCGGTLILTPDGPVPVEKLVAGDMILTVDHGPQPLRWIGSKKVQAVGKLAPIRISAGSLGNGLPRRDLLVSRQHRFPVKSKVAEKMFDTPEVLVSAIKLAELPGISIEESAKEVSYYHMLFDRHEIVYAEGLPAESLFTGPLALKAIPQEARDEVLKLFPDAVETGKIMEHARYIPDGQYQKSMIRQHLQKGLELEAIPA